MLGESNKIIIVDDNKEHLKMLSSTFYNNGLGCKSLEYSSLYEKPLKGIRIAFFDVNLCNSTNDKERNSNLCQALRDYISIDNGAYVLMFWTSEPNWINSFLDYIDERQEENIPIPYYIGSIAKEDVLQSPDKLKEKLDTIFELPSVKLAFEYETIIADSVYNTISNIIGTIPSPKKWADVTEFENNCKSVFSAIAFQHSGKNAKTNPDRAIKEALIPICMSSFVNHKDSFWTNYLKINNNTSFPCEYKVSMLNNIFNLELNEKFEKTDRGALCELKKAETEKMFDIKLDQLLLKTLPLFDEKNKYDANFIDEIQSKYLCESRIICVEFSSACDYSWNKPRTNKYLLGMMIPAEYTQYISKKRPDYCLSLDDTHFFINSTEQFFCFNLNFTFALSLETERIIGEPICQFKKELMDMIGNRYANHISRIGITSFRKNSK